MSKIAVIGAWNTGTNLIHNILSNSNCINTITNSKIEILEIHKPIWKHHPNKNVIEKIIKDDPERIIIIMYRNIYNWINGMLKQPYEVKFKDIGSHTIIKTGNHDKYDFHFSNIVNLYNHYYEIYKNMAEKYKNVILIDYNKIINKNISYDYINFKLSRLNLTITSFEKMMNELNTPAKKHGNSVKNSDDAMLKKNKDRHKIEEMIEIKYNNLKKFINNTLIAYYENDYTKYYENDYTQYYENDYIKDNEKLSNKKVSRPKAPPRFIITRPIFLTTKTKPFFLGKLF
jgi:hypothetical protein